jgi:hypothetical protein
MCSALLPVTAVNDQSQAVLQSCFRSYVAFDSGAGDSVQRSCNLIVKGLLLTCAVFPRFKVPKPHEPRFVSLPVDPPSPSCHGHPEQSLGRASVRYRRSVPGVPRPLDFDPVSLVYPLVAAFRLV